MSILFAHFVYLDYSYKQSCNCVLPAAVSCGPVPKAPANGRKIDSGTTFGSTVTYTCSTGYTPQGDNGHTCMANGEWSGSTPTCNRKLHTVLFLLLHGIKTPRQWYCSTCDDSWGFTWIWQAASRMAVYILSLYLKQLCSVCAVYCDIWCNTYLLGHYDWYVYTDICMYLHHACNGAYDACVYCKCICV